MATSQDIPSYEDLCAENQPPTLSPDFLRLRWKPFGPLATSINVASNACDLPSAADQAYSQGATIFHPISAAPLTKPFISSIIVTQEHLVDWEQQWVDEHLPHADYDGAVWVAGGEVVIDENAPEYENPGDDETGRILLRCCDENRPPAQAPQLVVRPSTKPYVTIHDYITAVHAWLQTNRDDILRARGVHNSGPVPADTVFYVYPVKVDTAMLDDGQGRSDFSCLWSQVAGFAARLNGADGGFPTTAHIAAARRPLDPQSISQHPPRGNRFVAPKLPELLRQNQWTGPAPSVPGQLMHKMDPGYTS